MERGDRGFCKFAREILPSFDRDFERWLDEILRTRRAHAENDPWGNGGELGYQPVPTRGDLFGEWSPIDRTPGRPIASAALHRVTNIDIFAAEPVVR